MPALDMTAYMRARRARLKVEAAHAVATGDTRSPEGPEAQRARRVAEKAVASRQPVIGSAIPRNAPLPANASAGPLALAKAGVRAKVDAVPIPGSSQGAIVAPKAASGAIAAPRAAPRATPMAMTSPKATPSAITAPRAARARGLPIAPYWAEGRRSPLAKRGPGRLSKVMTLIERIPALFKPTQL